MPHGDYVLSINRHEGPLNFLRMSSADGERTLLAIQDRGITTADDLTEDEMRLLIRVLAEQVRVFYIAQGPA